MGTRIQDIAPTTFSLGNLPVVGASFQSILILSDADHAGIDTNSVTSYANLAEMSTAGSPYALTDDEYLMAADIWGQTSKDGKTVGNIKVGNVVGTDPAADLAAVIAVDPDFYVVLPVTAVKADITAISAAIETPADGTHRIAYYTTRDADVLAGTADNIALLMQTAAQDRSVLIYTATASEWPSASWVGATLPDKLYGINTCYYPMSGLTVTALTGANITELETEACNRIETIGGLTVVPGTSSGQSGNTGGIVSSGEFIDKIVAKDYLESRVSTAIYNLIIANKKIPFNQAGSDLIRGTIESALITYGVNENIINDLDENSVVMPDLATYSSTKKANRWFDGITGSNTLSGAISKISIAISLTS